MPEIGIADKATLDTVKALIGTNVDAAGVATVFARLAQIAGYIDQVEGYTDTLEANVGSNADASSISGSVHAKLKDLRQVAENTYIQATTVKNTVVGALGFLNGNFSTSSNSWTTALNITGAGCLQLLRVTYAVAANVALTGCVRVTLDGIALTDNFNYSGMNVTYGYSPHHTRSDIGTSELPWGSNIDQNIDAPLYFKTSLKIEIKVPSTTTGTVTAGWRGGLY